MDYRSLKIEVSGLSGRVINLLRREGIETVGELMSRSPESLGKMKTCGKKALEEIMETIIRFEKMEQNEDSKDKELASVGSVDTVIGDYIEWTKSQEGNEYITTWLKNEQLKISSMDLLSTRAYNYLLLNGYIYVHQIVFMTIEELMHIPRMDLHTAEEIAKACIYFLEEKENVIIDSYHNSRENKKDQISDVMMEMLYNCEYHDRILAYVIINDVILDKTECSNRMKNMLHKNDCYKLSDFIFMTEFELLNIPGMGNKTAEEIISFVKEYILEHENKLLAYCNGDDSILEESLEITALTLLRSKKYHDRFLQYIKNNDLDIEQFNCSERAKNQLKANNIYKLSDCIFFTRRDLSNISHFGNKSVEAVLHHIDSYLSDHETQLIAFCKGDDSALWNDFSLRNKILDVYAELGFSGLSLHEIREKANIPELVTDMRLKSIIGKMIAEGLLEYVDFRCHRVYPAFSDYITTCSVIKERNRDIIARRLQGETLESIAVTYGMTRERVRQIIKKDIQKAIDNYHIENGSKWFDEDYYRYFFETYAIEKKDAEKWLGIDSCVINYLELTGSDRGTAELEDALNDYQNLDYGFRLKIKNYINKDKLYLNGKWIEKKRGPLEDYVVRNYCTDNVSFSDFTVLFNNFLHEEEVQYNENIYYTEAIERTRKNRLADSRFLLWKQNEQIRYYDIDGQDYSELYDAINLSAYENIEYSTLKFIRDFPEIMQKYDIRDQYELHNLLRKTVDEGSYHDLHFERTPMIRFGSFDRDSALLDLLIDNAPISIMDFAELISQEYGYDPMTVIGSYLSPFAAYLHNGMYSIDYKAMPYGNKVLLQQKLTDDFYYIDEIRKIYINLFPKADSEEINPYTLKLMGFIVRSRYAVQNYNSLDAYFRDLLTSVSFDI